jgi:hypothetical protein
MENIMVNSMDQIKDYHTYKITEKSTEENRKIWKTGANTWKVSTIVAEDLAKDVILRTIAFNDFRIFINRVDQTLTICRKTLNLNKEISCSENIKLGPKRARK